FIVIRDGLILSFLASFIIMLSLRHNPRIWLQDYPPDIQDLVHSKTEGEKRLSLVVGIPFLVLLIAVPFVSTLVLKNQSQGNISFFTLTANAFGVAFIFNFVDWLILDWIIFCWITPAFLVIPGTERAEGYKDYQFHFRGFLMGTILSLIAGLVIGGFVFIL
ncbi:MAG: nitroreductase, partial [Chloroflexi bacterium]|nr:nitroreductase [Chloroflexota bacterium]